MASLSLTLKPAQIELVAKPGISLTQAYQVTNNSDSSLIINSTVLPWMPVGSNGLLSYDNVFPNPHFSFSLANSDLQLGQSFPLRAGESRQLVLKIKSDSTTPLSDSYFTFFISQDVSNSLNPNGNLAATSGRLGSHILLSTSTNGSPASQSSIFGFVATPRFKDIFLGKIQFQATVENLSGYFFKTVGKLTITKNNLIIKELDLFPQNVLSHSNRSVNCNLDNLPVPCTINPPFWPGHYTATLTLDSSQSAAAAATISFYVFPYYLFLILAIISILFSAFSRLRQPKT